MTTTTETRGTALANRQPQRVTSIVRQAPRSLDETLRIAELLAKSGYFEDAKAVAQAVTKILYGIELGIAPVTAMMGVHIINGKPAPSAGLLASRIRSSQRYDYRIKRLDNQACTLEFFDGGQVVGEVTFTQEDARTAGAHEGRNKHTWRSFPRNMLFARALSNGARWYTPDLFGGPVYTPEELGAQVDSEGTVVDVPFVPVRERDAEDEGDRAAALAEWARVSAKADALGIEHKTLPEDAPASKLRRWTEALADKVRESGSDQTPAVEPPTAAEKAAPVDPTTGEVLEDRSADPPSAEPQGRTEATPPASVRRPSRADVWQRNRELCNRATELGLHGVPTVPQLSSDDVVAQANEDLAGRIRAWEAGSEAEPEL